MLLRVAWTCKGLCCGAWLALLCCAGSSNALAQARPEPGSVQVPAHTEDTAEQSASVGEIDDEESDDLPKGKLRIWVGGASPQTRLAVGLAKPGQAPPDEGDEDISDFVWVHRGMRPGDLYQHVNVPVGSFEPMIFEETIVKFTPENLEPKAPQWKSVVRRTNQSVRIAEGSCQTLILDLQEERPTLSLLNDKASAGSPSTIRLLNLTEEQGVNVLIQEAGGKERSLAENLTTTIKELTMPAAATTASFVVELPSPGTKMKARVFREADFRLSRLFYLVVSKDRYDRLQARTETGCR